MGGDFVFDEMSVRDFMGLFGLSQVDGELIVGSVDAGNDALETLAGLGALQRLGGLRIHGNDALVSLAGARSLMAIDGDLEVAANPILPTCEVTALIDRTGADAITGATSVSDTDDDAVCE